MHMLHHEPDSLIFLSDRQKGLIQGVTQLFPSSPHTYCLRHLEENFRKKFKSTDLTHLLWKAAIAITEADFNQCLQDMKTINPVSVNWLLQTANPEHWADLYFKGRRYGHSTSNIAEAFNAKLMEAWELTVLAMLEGICHQLIGWIADRRHLEDKLPREVGLIILFGP